MQGNPFVCQESECWASRFAIGVADVNQIVLLVSHMHSHDLYGVKMKGGWSPPTFMRGEQIPSTFGNNNTLFPCFSFFLAMLMNELFFVLR